MLDQAVADECRALFSTVVGERDPLWPLHIDVARQVLAADSLLDAARSDPCCGPLCAAVAAVTYIRDVEAAVLHKLQIMASRESGVWSRYRTVWNQLLG